MSRLVWKIIQMKMARAIHLEAGRKCQHRTMICPKNRDQKDERGDQIGPRIHDVKQKVTRFFVNLNSPSNHPTVHRQLGISHLFFCKVGIIHIRAHIRCKFSFHWLFFFFQNLSRLRGLLNYTCVTWKVGTTKKLIRGSARAADRNQFRRGKDLFCSFFWRLTTMKRLLAICFHFRTFKVQYLLIWYNYTKSFRDIT